jgi:hypothetical protein
MSEPRYERPTVVVLTQNFRIRGRIDCPPEERVTDYVVKAKSFIAVTDAEVRDFDGRVLFNAQFLNLHRDHIVVIAPEELTSRN